MKIRKILPSLMCVMFLTGCFDYRDMNKLFFATAVIIDIDQNKAPVVYLETFKAYRGQAQENGTEIKVVFKGTGKTLYEAYINASLSASNHIDTTQIKALIFTERAASQGLDKFIDIFSRDQKPTVRMFLFVLAQDQSPEKLTKLTTGEEDFVGLYLEDLMNSQGKLNKVYRIRLNEYNNRRLLGSTVEAIPIVRIRPEEPYRLEVNGAAVVKSDKMVGKLSPEELTAYNYVAHGGNFGVLLADDPNNPGSLVSLKALRSRVKLSVDYDGKTFTLTKHISATTVLIEAQNRYFILDNDTREKIEKSASEKLKFMCLKVFNDYKQKGIDIYNVTRMVEIKYPHVNTEDILDKTQLGVADIQVHIDGSNNRSNFY